MGTHRSFVVLADGWVFRVRSRQLPESFSLLKDKTIIGRDAMCDVHLEWDGMSRNHAVIVGTGGDANLRTPAGGRVHSSFRIQDMGSSNGTYVNFVVPNPRKPYHTPQLFVPYP